jgi:hypothetical protein
MVPATVIDCVGSIESKKIVPKLAVSCAERFEADPRRLEDSGGMLEPAGIVAELFTTMFVPAWTVATEMLSVEVKPLGAGIGAGEIAAFATAATATD